MFLRNDNDEEGRPVGKDGEEIGEDLGEMFTACYACDGVTYEDEDCPEEARD